jgi:CubicO group peptidase (beta-lactamase class C family)
MKKLLLLLVLAHAGVIASAQSWADTVAAIEKIYSRYKPDEPGAELAISRNGQVIFSKAWGMADLEHGAQLTTSSLTEAGSVSKQFTAASILLLEQQGKLSLGDDVHKYIPELPDYGVVITLRHLMQHISGLKDWGSVMEVAGWPRSTREYSNEYALYIITLQQSLNNKPGDEYIYSNTNYNLLATIVQRVSGESLAVFTQKNIFAPAGMTHTQWRTNFRKVVRDRAMAYSKSGANYYTNMPNENVYGQGGLLTTAEDLLAWNRFYLGGKLGNPSLLSKQTATNPLNNGRINNYGAGLVMDSVNGQQAISHNGATASYRANLEYFPAFGLSFAWLSNTSAYDRDTFDLHNAVRSLFLPARKGAVTRRHIAITLTPEKLASYVGWYRHPRTGGGLKLFIKEGKLYNQYTNSALVTVAEHVFYLGNNRIEVTPGKRLLYITAIRDSIYYDKVVEADTLALADYVGDYYSKEAEAFYAVVLKGGKLLLSQKPDTEITLEPTYKDGFESPLGPVWFVREQGKITGFKISVSRARNIGFQKK